MDELLTKKIDDFFLNYKPQKYKKGEILVRADDDPAGIFYLKEGYVKQYIISQKGEELVVNVFKPFAFFPMSWAINNTPNTYFFEAMNDILLYRCPKEDVLFFLKNNADVVLNLLSRVYKGTDGMMSRMTYLMSGNAYYRLVAEIVIQAKRFGKVSGKSIEIKISEKDIASQSGMTRETVSREMKRLKEKGLLTFSTNLLRISDLNNLEDELSAS